MALTCVAVGCDKREKMVTRSKVVTSLDGVLDVEVDVTVALCEDHVKEITNHRIATVFGEGGGQLGAG